MRHYADMAIDHDMIRQRIRQRIDQEAGLSMRNVSIAAFGSDSALHKFLNRSNESIRLINLASIADVIGVDLSWLLFGPRDQPISGDVVQQMIDNALEEIQPGMSLAEIRRAAASALHAQIKLHLSDGAGPETEVEASARDTAAQSPSPTT